MDPQHYKIYVSLAYALAALLTLVSKMVQSVRYETQTNNKRVRDAVLDWFFAPTKDNVASWIGTIIIVWCIGAAYINGWTMDFMPDWFAKIPVRIPVAALLGWVAEWLVPDIVKLFTSKATDLAKTLFTKVFGTGTI